jgi:hypothetical protein
MPTELIAVSEQDEEIFEAWQSGKGPRTIAREMGLSKMAVEQALDRVLPVINQQTQGRSYKRQLFLMEDLNTEFYAIAKRDKSIEAAHLCARLNERICAMNGWSSVNLKVDPVAAQTAEQPTEHEQIRDAILRIARPERYANNGNALAPPTAPSEDDQNRTETDGFSPSKEG